MKKSQPIRIFLVDDDSVDRELFSEALTSTKLPFTLNEAESGIELLSRLQDESYKPDVIFLDLNMPVKDGRETLRDLKSDKKLSAIPVIIFSTSNSHFDIQQSYQSGASLFVSKPRDFNDLVDMLTNFLALGSKHISFPN